IRRWSRSSGGSSAAATAWWLTTPATARWCRTCRCARPAAVSWWSRRRWWSAARGTTVVTTAPLPRGPSPPDPGGPSAFPEASCGSEARTIPADNQSEGLEDVDRANTHGGQAGNAWPYPIPATREGDSANAVHRRQRAPLPGGTQHAHGRVL